MGRRANCARIWKGLASRSSLLDRALRTCHHRQGFNKLTLEQNLAHSGQPVLRWMMDNIFIRTDPAGNIKVDKEKSTERIDGAVATIMALDRAVRGGGDHGGSVYNGRGLLVL